MGEYTNTTRHILRETHSLLKSHGYRKKKKIFNRSLDSKLIHVIQFQLGRRSLYGKLTINLGVFIPEIHKLIWDRDMPKFADYGDCEIVKRIGELLSPPEDLWLDLGTKEDELVMNAVELLKLYGLPYLDQFLSNDDIIRKWQDDGEDIGLPARAGLSIAILLANQGHLEQAENLLKQEYIRKKGEPYAGFVINIADKLGIGFST